MERINDIIKKISCVEEKTIKNTTDLIIDLGFDSIKFIQLLSEIEEKFSIEFEIEELNLDQLRSVEFLVNLVNSKMK